MKNVLEHVAKYERFTLPEETITLIADDANGNMRKALLVLEALKMQKCVPPLLAYPLRRPSADTHVHM